MFLKPTAKSSELDMNICPLLRSGQKAGWLSEKTWTFVLSSYTQRFFTVDFGTRMLYCSDSEFGGKVSTRMPFCDILDVEPLKNKTEAHCWSGVSCLAGIGKEAQHDFVIYTKTKRVEVRCTSLAESRKWIATIQDAIIQETMLLHMQGTSEACNGEVVSNQSTRSCSRESTFKADEWEQDFKEHTSDEVAEQFDLNEAIDLTSGRVPQSTIAQPGRCFSAPRTRSASNVSISSVGSCGAWERTRELSMERPLQPVPDSPLRVEAAVPFLLQPARVKVVRVGLAKL